jgi:hypothetical protein
MILIPSDFNGKHKISQDCYSELTAYINKYEPIYLIALLGVPLFRLFKDDLNEVTRLPNTERFEAIVNPIYERTGISEGLSEMLKGFVFWEYVKDNKFKVTESGVHVSTSDISRNASFTEFNIYGYYNDSVRNYKAIRNYIKANETIYPEFEGVDKQLAHWAL